MPAVTLHHTDASSRPAAPAVARPMRSETEPDDCEGEVRLWIAALALLLEDASDYLRRGDDKQGIRGAAYRDVVAIGEMLRYVCAHARVDPHLAREWWQRKMRQAAQRSTPDALKVERDENDQRKEPATSEKVALAEAIEARLPKRDGIRHDTAPAKEIFPELKGQNRDIAAAKAGLGSGKTLEAAQKVVERGIPELVEAMMP